MSSRKGRHKAETCSMADRFRHHRDTTPAGTARSVRAHTNERHRSISAGQRHIARLDTTDWDAARTVQVRVSLWTWGFKSPLAHFTASPAYEARYRRIDGTPPPGVGGVSRGRDTPLGTRVGAGGGASVASRLEFNTQPCGAVAATDEKVAMCSLVIVGVRARDRGGLSLVEARVGRPAGCGCQPQGGGPSGVWGQHPRVVAHQLHGISGGGPQHQAPPAVCDKCDDSRVIEVRVEIGVTGGDGTASRSCGVPRGRCR
jgi:hypothetical protein